MDFNLQHILTGCKKNDTVSQKALYMQYYNLFMTMCLRYVSDKADAEEVLNNAFLRIFKHINQYKNEGSFEGWMKKVVVNSCLAFIRTAGYGVRTKIISLQDNYEANHHSSALNGRYTAEEGMEQKYKSEYLMQLLLSLPEATRLVFNLYVFEDYNHKEIAEALDMAERTSQSHLAKARKILSTSLDRKELIQKIQRV